MIFVFLATNNGIKIKVTNIYEQMVNKQVISHILIDTALFCLHFEVILALQLQNNEFEFN